MNLAIILVALVTAAALCYGYYLAIQKLNAYASSRYEYLPVTVGKSVVAAIPFLLIIAGLFMYQSDPTNLWAAVVAALIVITGLFLRIAVKSSFGVAVVASPLLAIAGLGIGIVVATILLSPKRSKAEDHK